MIAQCVSLSKLGQGDAMLVAAMLFVVGWLIGRSYTAFVLAITSSVILFTALSIFISTYGFDLLHMLMTFGYLGAHQSGYLLGAHMSASHQNN